MNTRSTMLLAPLLVGLLAGCGAKNDTTAPTTSDPALQQQALTEEMGRNPEMVDDGLYETQSQAQTDANAGTAAIHPLFFWREILRVERRYTFAFADTDSTGQPTTAVVVVHKRLAGWFNVLAQDDASDGSPTQGHVVRKPLRDHWVRRLLFKRVRPMDDPEVRPWRLAAVSGVNITSRDAQTRVLSLRVQSGDLDTTITEPLAFFRLRRVLKLQPDAQVTLTATTQANDDVVVLYARDRRTRFHNNGDGTHSITWSSAAIAGLHHLGVNALSHDTLFDDVAPYDSQTWILPYVVAPTELAELAP